MRKLRDLVFYAFLIVPIVGIVVGVQYAMKKKKESIELASDSSIVSKMESKTETGTGAKSDSNSHEDVSRKVASAKNSSAAKTVKSNSKSAPDSESSLAGHFESAETPRLDTAASDPIFKAAPGDCTSLEFRGDASQKLQISNEDWAKYVKTHFDDVKTAYLGWVETQKNAMSEDAYNFFKKQVRFTRIQRPPVSEEPDLSWRGIATWSLDAHQEPLIRVGGGFLDFAKKHPTRAKFELARLMAQALAPCELKRAGLYDAWAKFSACAGVTEENACGVNSYSETGWAVSSALASQIVKLDCAIPAFKSTEAQACLSHFNDDFKLSRTWKAAQR